MCGIAGIIGRVNGGDNRAALERMNDAMAHRGPQGGHVWVSSADESGHGCLLAHRRLSILDLSTAADQPMVDPHGGHVIVFNGEIYNFKQLRADMEARGEQFTSTGDTAVMLRALTLYGQEAVRTLRGMFAFGLWDNQKRELMLARDPLGIKPLYLCRNPDPNGDWSLAFASEIRALLASKLIARPRLNPRAVASVIWNGFVMGPDTAVDGIVSLQPGEWHIVDSRGKLLKSDLYWSMPAADEGKATRESLTEVLQESTKLHLVSDVPLGVFLSGGIDSSAVANLAQKASTGQVDTFTLAFEEDSYNEAPFARKVADAIGSRHHEILLTESQFLGSMETAIDTLDQPTFDGLNSYFISKAAREAGPTVVLIGAGGDELFGGYSSFKALPSMLGWANRSGMIPKRAKILAARLASKVLAPRGATMPAQTRWAKLPDMVRADSDLIELYQLAYALFLPDFQEQLLLDGRSAEALESGLTIPMHHRLRAETAGHAPLSAISVLEQRCFLGERLLRDIDATSMSVSLETRLPLVDHVVVEHVNRLSESDRYQPAGRKQVLRDAGLAGLDPALFERPKSGFVLPFDRWIRSKLSSTMSQVMCDSALAGAVGLNGEVVSRLWSAFQAGAPGLYWSRVWALYVLIRWCHRHQVLL